MATMNRDFARTLAEQASGSGWEPPEGSMDGMDTMGEPASRLTTEVDVTRWIDQKRQAMRAHASQIGEASFFLSMPEDVFSMVWGREWYIRVRPPWRAPADGRRESALDLGGDRTADTAAGRP
jgi:LmbE family N-acetylglucosaminyl deacetylase